MNLLSVLQTIGEPRITAWYFDADPELVSTITTLMGEGEHQGGAQYEWIRWEKDGIEVLAFTN